MDRLQELRHINSNERLFYKIIATLDEDIQQNWLTFYKTCYLETKCKQSKP